MKKTIVMVFCAAALTAGTVRAQPPAEAYPGLFFFPDGSAEPARQDPAPAPDDTPEATIQEIPGSYNAFSMESGGRLDNAASAADDESSEKIGDPDGVHFIQSIEYRSRIGFYEALVRVPEIRGMADAAREASLNERFRSTAYTVIDEFANDARAILSDYTVEDAPHYQVGYDFRIPARSDSTLTLALTYYSVAGSSYYTTSFFNFDRRTRALIELDDYFVPGSAAASILRGEILRQMRLRMAADENQVFWIDGLLNPDETLDWDALLTAVRENNGYYFNDRGELVVVFGKYDVGPGSMGAPEFVIPAEVRVKLDEAVDAERL